MIITFIRVLFFVVVVAAVVCWCCVVAVVTVVFCCRRYCGVVFVVGVVLFTIGISRGGVEGEPDMAQPNMLLLE